MNLWKRLFGGGKSDASRPASGEGVPQPAPGEPGSQLPPPAAAAAAAPAQPPGPQPPPSAIAVKPSPEPAGTVVPAYGPGSDERRIRVFVSSTFRDMHAERDYLVKFIFPQLRKLCEERAVSWTEVDLRWGITAEESAEGKVLPLCLAEIERCRPYFIGMLGERYGWVPDSIPQELLDSQEWLKEHLQHSVTELEILHGVLLNPAMADRSLFYFRDPTYLNHLPEGSDPADFAGESPTAAARLAGLKQRIRDEHSQGTLKFAPRENYSAPEALGVLVLADFTAIIEDLYPKKLVKEPLDQEAARHEAYAQSRRLAFVGRADLLLRMTEHVATGNKPLVLTGESGCGKSALLAEWAACRRNDHPDDLVIQHYIGSTPESADWQSLVRRILGELKKVFYIPDEIPLKPDALRGALNDWLMKAAGNRRVVLVLDALNQLSSDDAAARELDWLPFYFTPKVCVLVSSLPGVSLDAVRKRGWPEMAVPLFGQSEIAPAATAYFAIFGKKPPKDVLAKLESTPAACNALYLRAVLDELRQFGIHEQLQAKAANYLSAPDLPALFDRILTRWHDDFGQNREHPDLERRSLCLIACARFGLSETELLDLLGKDGAPLPRRHWTPFYLAVENALALRAGLLNFGHDHLCDAVRKRWLEERKNTRGFRMQIAEYFARVTDPTDRKLDELPTLYSDMEQWEKLKDLLADIPTFLRLRDTERRKWELHGFWIPLKKKYNAGEEYREALSAHEACLSDKQGIAPVLTGVALFHLEAADHQSAEPLMRRALEIDEKSFGHEHPRVAIHLNNLAELLQATNRLAEAEPLMRRALEIDEKSFGHEHPRVAIDLNNLAALLQATNRLAEAEPLMRRALEIDEKSFGHEHPGVAIYLNNLATLLKATNRLAEAEPLMRRALEIDEKSFGPEHPKVTRDLNNLALLLKATNRLAEAEPLMRRALEIDKKSFSPEHPDVAIHLNSLAELLEATNRLAEAEPLMRRALEIDEKSFGPIHPQVAIDLNNLAQLLKATNRLAEAEPLMRRVLEIFLNFTRATGHPHPHLQAATNNYTRLLKAMGLGQAQIQAKLQKIAPELFG